MLPQWQPVHLQRVFAGFGQAQPLVIVQLEQPKSRVRELGGLHFAEVLRCGVARLRDV